MTSQGLLGFRYREKDKLAYNRKGSEPDLLGLKLLHELRNAKSWDRVKERARDLIEMPESRLLGETTTLAESELRRYFPDL